MAGVTEARVRIDGSVATITFVTEGGINVMSSASLERLARAVAGVAANANVRTTVLRAEGKAFLAGADIKEMSGFDAWAALQFSRRGNEVMDALAGLPSITVAAIQGAALGGGCEVALACDFRIAVESARIGLPETSLGLIPGWGGTQRSLALLGPSRARRVVWSATAFEARQARELGLVDEVVSDAGQLDGAVSALLEQFRRGGPRAIAMAKRAFLTGDEPGAFAACFEGGESREGMSAFIEKRKAAWIKE